MDTRLLKKNSVKNLCLQAGREWEIYAPLESVGGDVQFMRLKDKISLERLSLDYPALLVPPKTVAFGQLQTLFNFKGKKIIPSVKKSSKKLLFGLRACDAKGILFLDEFFRRNYEDIYYLSRTKDKLLVVVGCKKPQDNCFCTSTKTGPFLKTGFDLQLVDIGDSYLVEVGSQQGERFVSKYSRYFARTQEDDRQQANQAKYQAEEAVSLRVDFDGAIKKFVNGVMPEDIYERIGERCIYCGGCLYVCPTCSCFNVFDELGGESGRRLRNWDTCVFSGYTREASGHNPRAEKWIRTARRYEHKLKYDYLTTGMSGCVGCGRCLSSCPVKIGISQVIQEVA